MKTMAQICEEKLRKQRPVSFEAFWKQVEAFKDPVEPIQESSSKSEDSKPGRPLVVNSPAANG